MTATPKSLIAGNWKMNGLLADGMRLAADVRDQAERAGNSAHCEVLICPPATLLHPIGEAVAGSIVALGGQDCHESESGAFTGSVSAAMLADAGCRYVIVGHSERRHGLGETSAMVRAKAAAALAAGLTPVLCVGETLDERDGGDALEVVGQQLQDSLPRVDGPALVVAYEPVWAIGTGRIPGHADIEAMHSYIRARLVERLAEGERTRILYGGSVNGSNAASLLGLAEVNGVLVGGASLEAESFAAIIDAAG